MAGAFGKVFANINSSQSQVTSSVFGTSINSNNNPFPGNATNSNHNTFDGNAFGNTTNSNRNPFAPNAFRNTFTSNSDHFRLAPKAFGNTINYNQNPFAYNNALGNSSHSDHIEFAPNAFGNTTHSNHNPFAPSVFGKASYSNHKPFAANSVGTSTSTYGGHSTGVFAASSASSTAFTFGQRASFSKSSSSMFGTASIGSHGPFSSTTSGGPFGGLPSTDAFRMTTEAFGEHSTGVVGAPLDSYPIDRFGNELARASASSAMVGLTSTNSSNAVAFLPFKSTTPSLTTLSDFGRTNSIVPEAMPACPFSSASSAAENSFSQPIFGRNTGSRISSYKQTVCLSEGSGCKFMSISAMPFYESKSHEELRWEDYELKSRGQQNSVNNQAVGINKQNFAFQYPSVPSSLSTISPPCIVPEFTTKLNAPTFSIPCMSSPNTTPVFSAFHNKTPAATGAGCHQVATITNNKPLPNLQLPSTESTSGQVTANNPWQYNENSVIHTTQAPIPSIAPVIPAGSGNNEGVSLDIGRSQPSLPQQNLTISKVKDIIAVKDPFGSEHTTSQPSIGLSACSFFRHGISSLPVPNKPTKTRVSSVLTSRHHSLKPLVVNVRKYHPSSDVPKVPFFDRVDKIQDTSKAYSHIMPRENPREVFAPSELTHVSTSKDKENAHDNSKKDQISSSTPNSLNNHFAENNDIATEIYEQLIPKLQRSDYYTDPDVKKLASIESINPGFCCHVKDFVVGRDGYGWVKFYGETDVRGLDLDSLIHFKNHEVLVYDNDCEKPPVGKGLNKAAEVTLLNIKCIDKKTGRQYISGKMVDNFTEKLKKVAEKQGAEFVAYDPVKGEWKFSVQHF